MMTRMMTGGLVCFLCLFLTTACGVPQATTQKREMPANASIGSGATKTGGTLDNLENDIRQALAASEAAAVSREGDHLTVTFRGDVTFDKGSAIVKPGLYAEIDRLARVLARYPEAVIRVEGYTDSEGSEAYNMKLSIQRAEAVRDLLFKQGTGTRWIAVVGFGETRPIATNDTEAGRQKNRRVEIKVFPQTR